MISTRKYARATKKNGMTSNISKSLFCWPPSISEANDVADMPKKPRTSVQEDANHNFNKSSTRKISTGKNARAKKRNGITSNISKTSFCFAPWIDEINDIPAMPQDRPTSIQSESVSITEMASVSKTRFNVEPNPTGYRNAEFKCDACLENTFFFSTLRCIKMNAIRRNISANKTFTIEETHLNHQEVKIVSNQNLPVAINLSSAQSFGKRSVVSNILIPTLSKANEIVYTLKVNRNCVNELKQKSVSLNDPVYELIRQQRLSWWSSRDEMPSIKPRSKLKCFHERSRMDFYRSYSDFKNISSKYECQGKFRVRKFERWQSDIKLYNNGSQRYDSKEPIVMAAEDKKSFSYQSEFSDESDLDDSGSSLDGSYLHSSSDTSESSDCESWSSLNVSYRKRSVPPTSSRIFGDSIIEIETGFRKTFREQFWSSDLVKNPDKNFVEDFGFISVTLQALQCLCQCSENGEI